MSDREISYSQAAARFSAASSRLEEYERAHRSGNKMVFPIEVRSSAGGDELSLPWLTLYEEKQDALDTLNKADD